MRSIRDVINSLNNPPPLPRLEAPRYRPPEVGGLRVGLAVESMARHMTDEGWQLFLGLRSAGYVLDGYGIPPGETDVVEILRRRMDESVAHPSTVVLQDKREWEGLTADRSRDPNMRFRRVECLKDRPHVFKLTVLKDAQNSPNYHRQSAEEIGCHAWVVYYHPDLVAAIAPYVRREHLVRTYHTIDPGIVPKYQAAGRKPCVLSGAVSGAYPLRQKLINYAWAIPEMSVLKHPGYHRNGCMTPDYVRELSQYKVAVCTSSVYGYALRKIIEATAAGCRVLTDLPYDDVLPMIDGNLVRISPHDPIEKIGQTIRRMVRDYDPAWQAFYAAAAVAYYDYRVRGEALARDIESLRRRYPTCL